MILYDLRASVVAIPSNVLSGGTLQKGRIDFQEEKAKNKDCLALNKAREAVNKECLTINKEREAVNKDCFALNMERETVNKECLAINKERKGLHEVCSMNCVKCYYYIVTYPFYFYHCSDIH